MPLTLEEIKNLARKHNHDGINSAILTNYLKLVSDEYTENQIPSVNASKEIILRTLAQAGIQAQDDLLDGIALLSDPNDDRILFWDESANNFAFLSIGSGLTLTGTELVADALAGPANFVAGNQLIQSADTNRTETSTSYVKKKEIKLGRVFGTLRIKFDLLAQSPGGGSDKAYGRIYKNGVAEGTERTVVIANGTVTFSQDISGWETGDLIQLYAKKEGTLTNATVANFRIYVKYLEKPEVITD